MLYKNENGRWLDCGYDFRILETERYYLKYMEGETRVEEFREMIDIAYDNLETIFEERPDENFEIKLFYDREMLRQRTIPSIGWLFTGWGEPNESLKIYTGRPASYGGYNGVLQHEVVHHITIKICNNNLPVWILEGAAMYYDSAYFDHGLSTTLSNLKKENIKLTVDYLENKDLYNAEIQQEIWDWYNASYIYTGYIVETYGHGKYMELYYEAGNITLDEILMSVLGITKEELTESYLEWLEITDYFEKN